MIIINGKEAHPLRKTQTQFGDQLIHAWNTKHNRSWFILDLALGERQRESSDSALNVLISKK